MGVTENVAVHYLISTRLHLNPELHQVKIKKFYSFQWIQIWLFLYK
jgi:hypothetical protein